MIIFDLDGTLADCEHRRHFVDPIKAPNTIYGSKNDKDYQWYDLQSQQEWKPDWTAFYEACGEDKPIEPVMEMLIRLTKEQKKIQIWSGRCESVREKTELWLEQYINIPLFYYFGGKDSIKMRPVGDNTPDHELKERWLDEYLNSSLWPPLDPPKKKDEGKVIYRRDAIDLVFDSDPNSIAMWRRRGIFVFNCCQNDEGV